jgi:hypothetical protein
MRRGGYDKSKTNTDSGARRLRNRSAAMFEKLKTLIQPAADPGRPRSIHVLSPEARAALAVEVRFLMHNMLKVEDYPYLSQLGQTAGSNFDYIQIPISALPGLAREIETIRDKLPEKSPLLKVADSVRNCRGMDLVLAPASDTAAAPALDAGNAAGGDQADSALLSATTKLRILKTAADGVDVADLSASQLSDPELAAYFKFCLGLGDYDTIIATLRPRAANDPRVWVWSLLVAAMRLSQHPDFPAVVVDYQAWMVAHHPETLNYVAEPGEKRKFNGEKIAAIEARELATG